MAAAAAVIDLKPVYGYIDEHKAEWIEKLRTAVRIAPVSGDPTKRDNVLAMMKWAKVRRQ